MTRRAKFTLDKDKALFTIVIIVENIRDLDYLILDIAINNTKGYYKSTRIENRDSILSIDANSSSKSIS